MARYSLKIREGSDVTREHFETLDQLFERVDLLVQEIAARADGKPASSMFRKYEAIELVHGRIEVTIANGLLRRSRGGVDVRRDGSIEAFVGRSNRIVIEPTPGETLPQALRRELTEHA